jgi:hypothetical protein
MVVPVLVTSCHVSENPNNGPDTAHTTMTATAPRRVGGDPSARVAAAAARSNRSFIAMPWRDAGALGGSRTRPSSVGVVHEGATAARERLHPRHPLGIPVPLKDDLAPARGADEAVAFLHPTVAGRRDWIVALLHVNLLGSREAATRVDATDRAVATSA